MRHYATQLNIKINTTWSQYLIISFIVVVVVAIVLIPNSQFLTSSDSSSGITETRLIT